MTTEMMTRKILTGGYQGYRAALDEGHYSSHCHNPAVFYNDDLGFYVSPDTNLIPNDDFRVCTCNFDANTGNFREVDGSPREYYWLRRVILAGESDCHGGVRDWQFDYQRELYEEEANN